MRILTRYVLREYVVPLFYCLSGFVSIYVLFELFGSFSRLMRADLPFLMTVDYFCAYLAPYVEWLVPAALMLAALYTMWSFCRHSELIAMRANGIGFLAIVKPILAVAIVMAAFVFWVNDRYVPAKAQWARQMKTYQFDLERLEQADKVVFRNSAASRTWSIGRILGPSGEHLEDVRVTIDRPGGGARLRNITAARVDYLDGEWWFVEPEVQHFDTKGVEVATPVPELDALSLRCFSEFDESPRDFLMQNRDPAYNSIADRIRYLRTHPDLAEKARQKAVYDLWAKLLAPLACIVITLFAIPAGIASGRQSVFRGILGALGMFFAFYGTVIGCMVLADVGWIPPVPAALCPYVVFLALGARAFYRQR